MNTLLSLILCAAMFFGMGTIPEVPQTTQVLKVQNIFVGSDEEDGVSVAADVEAKIALGTQATDIILALNGEGDSARLAVRLNPEGVVVAPSDKRKFSGNSDVLSVVTNGLTDKIAPMSLAPLFGAIKAQLLKGEISDDVTSRLFESLAKVTGVQTEATEVALDSLGTVSGETFSADVTLLQFFGVMDDLRAGEDAVSEILRSCLAATLRPDGSAYNSFSEIAADAEADHITVQMTRVRSESVRYDRIGVDAKDESEKTGSVTFECTAPTDGNTVVKFTQNISEDGTTFNYEAEISLAGTLTALQEIGFTDKMTLSTAADEVLPEPAATLTISKVHERTTTLKAACNEGLWTAALAREFVQTEQDIETEHKMLQIEYAQQKSEGDFVIGTCTLAYRPEMDIETNASFEIVCTSEPYTDVMEGLAEMEINDEAGNVSAMVLSLDLKNMNDCIRAILEEESVASAAWLMDIDLSDIVLFGETAQADASAAEVTPVPAETVDPEEGFEEV